ncbi:glycoside hydrolase domain-containing protein [Evansella cellulosilytica]|uniref:Rv2525c-like glycoside hydrolase-like domain-containing protein n=1 Tax=Evansella cellulosilytica (strain ATCC 21833 / DSM 2522 / FERM P-1141 / JCM 9156 / N-4) TaxID=649639 RepID=E6TQQ5_EVAC2|nr:glycoside hydrolase domain-containing protein [Evansella cellulosilytica]ADU30566.1 Domain of unknown function DUF1906 [Evansella cellulosilytica DSM 2522]
MNMKRLIPFFTALMLFIITATAFYIWGSEDASEPISASVMDDDNMEDSEDNSDSNDNGSNNNVNNSVDGDGSTIDNEITNEIYGSGEINSTIENEIHGENGEVNNSIDNTIEGNGGTVDNNIRNDITGDGNITNNIINNITNNIVSDNGDENGNGNGNGENGNGEENGEENGTDNGNGNGDGNGNGEDVPDQVWGVDSASLTTDEMLACVRENFGDPQVWGRYLGDKEGVSYGLTPEGRDLLHENDIQILVIWNHFEDATGYDKGVSEAEDAIDMARDFGVPEGVALFANVEPIYPIDSGFLLGWYETLQDSEYEAGVYGIFSPDEELYVAFETAAEENENILEDYYVWTASPYHGITTEENAPDYNPEAPEGATLAGWQYGIDAEACNIDTVWFEGEALDVFW